MKNSSRLLFSLSLVWAILVLLIGAWWLFLITHFEEILARVDHHRITTMLTWEGGTFLFLLFLISMTLFLLYLKDQKKAKSLQDFFASVTHELKTPLASIKLQGEVLSEMIDAKHDPALTKLLSRLIHDTSKLEGQMDKLLQLSRIERGGNLNLTSIMLVPFLKNLEKKFIDHDNLNIDITCDDKNITIIADEFALELIINNLFENTKKHAKSTDVKININTQKNNLVHLIYQDGGTFNGDSKKLATLFYKHDSKKGSGIGLYLIKKLLFKMHGQFRIELAPHLVFHLHFQKSEDPNA